MSEADVDAAAQYQASYKQTFGPPWGQSVLRDLLAFCRGAETCIVAENGAIDLHRTLVLEGRREVFLRIQNALGLTPEALIKLATRQVRRLGELDGG